MQLTKQQLISEAQRLQKISCYIIRQFFRNNCTYLAAALTFSLLLAMVPLMTVAFKLFSLFPVAHNLADQIQHFIFKNFIPSSGEILLQYLQGFVQQAGRLSLSSLGFLVITSILVIYNIEQAFNVIWHVAARPRAITLFVIYLVVLLFLPLLIGISLTISSYLMSLPLFFGQINQLGKYFKLLGFVPFFATWVSFTFIYVILPNRKVALRCALPAALIAAGLFELAKHAFALYLLYVPTYQKLYGALAILPLFLLWVYISWIIILLGAEITHALSLRHRFQPGVRITGLVQALCYMQALAVCKTDQQGLTLQDLCGLDCQNCMIEPEQQIYELLKQKLIIRQGHHYRLLSTSLMLTIYDIYLRLPWPLPTLGELDLLTQVEYAPLKKIFHTSGLDLQKTLSVPLEQVFNCDSTSQR